MFQKISRSVAIFIFLSLVIHLGLGTGLLNISGKAPTKDQLIEIDYIEPDSQTAKQLRPEAQIVEQQKQINDETPEDTKFLSQFNQTVQENTRAAKTGEFKNSAKPGVQKAGQLKPPVKQETPQKVTKGELPSLKKLKPQFSLTPQVHETQPGQAGDPSQTDDYLVDTKTGIQTLISTREFVYYSYYQRIKQQIRQYWGPSIQEKVKIIYRKGRTIASATDRVTQVIVTLDENGELQGVEVIGESGVKDFDDAAIEAFKSAAPFPNPPKGIVEKDKRIRIRWDFILEA